MKSKDSASGVYFIDDTNTGEEGSEEGTGKEKEEQEQEQQQQQQQEEEEEERRTSLAHQSDRGRGAALEAQLTGCRGGPGAVDGDDGTGAARAGAAGSVAVQRAERGALHLQGDLRQ